MKKYGVGILLMASLLLVTACGNGGNTKETKKEDTSTSAKSAKDKKAKTSDKTSSEASTSKESEVVTPTKNELSIDGFWLATGKEDQKGSSWKFENNVLTVNGQENWTYSVADNLDKNGYTVITITNDQSENHALLVKKTANGFEGITVEGDAYQSYLNDENAPVGNQVITFVPQTEIDNLTWSGIDNAIDFYEGVYKNTANEESKDINWDNYRRDLWTIVPDGTQGNTITLHWTNIGGAGGSYVQLIKGQDTTEMIQYDGNAAYPDSPSKKMTIRNSDFKVL
ncbi:MAG: hypothetical protein IJI90_11850 [Carnobacterium sp.]|uniref:hypothetical protein n=1 Tax=Carnobacterium TaxID=2747 RepID=UPI00165C99D2|nr:MULTISPECIES: hypothetical protein [Carnobacterium]MBC9786982.1 hypothetical protein [Carnobacterium maltaromaticum]MBQ6485685.1 hypothetical protein [Carnobacterium sp.]